MYGIQTIASPCSSTSAFENDVKMYGIQTKNRVRGIIIMFENDVKMYGIQTVCKIHKPPISLRMM